MAGHITQTAHYLYCKACYTNKRIFLSTSDQEIQSFYNHHSRCLYDKEKVKESYPFQLRDWKDRTGREI